VTSRALIIGIENYAQATDAEKKLDGTLANAHAFRDWVEKKWDAEGIPANERQLIFCSEPKQPGGRGASRADILTALDDIKAQGQNATRELLFFFSGHGFSFVKDDRDRPDCIIPSDYVSTKLSGPLCFRLTEIVNWLRDHLGAGNQYFFVDACRTEIDASKVQVGNQLQWDAHARGQASNFILQSTEPANTAAAVGPFGRELVAGLKGAGIAKTWENSAGGEMYVRFDTLRRYLKTTLTGQRVTGSDSGETTPDEAVLATLKPPPLSTCEIEVDVQPPAATSGYLQWEGPRALSGGQLITAPGATLAFLPDDYTLKLEVPGAIVTPPEYRLKLFDRGSAKFVVTASAGGPPPPGPVSIGSPGPAPVAFKVHAPQNTRVTFRNMSTGAVTGAVVGTSDGMSDFALPPGPYLATVETSTGYAYRRAEVDIGTAPLLPVEFRTLPSNAAHVSIGQKLPHHETGIDFSETLGAEADNDLDLWLAIVGGGRILGGPSDFSKLKSLPLAAFPDTLPGQGGVYVLAGFADAETKIEASLFQVGSPIYPGVPFNAFWLADARQPNDMPGIHEIAFRNVSPGSKILGLRIGGVFEEFALATTTLPNRVTLVTITLDEGEPRFSQYCLPVSHLVQHLDPIVQERLERRNILDDLRTVARAQRAFRRRRDVRKVVWGSQGSEQVLYTKWVDPIASTMIAYELLRRDDLEHLGEAVHNLVKFYPELPDTHVLARRVGVADQRYNLPVRISGFPLFIDGFGDRKAWFGDGFREPDRTGPWTLWRGRLFEGRLGATHVVQANESPLSTE
jgi:hypothetical protein